MDHAAIVERVRKGFGETGLQFQEGGSQPPSVTDLPGPTKQVVKGETEDGAKIDEECGAGLVGDHRGRQEVKRRGTTLPNVVPIIRPGFGRFRSP